MEDNKIECEKSRTQKYFELLAKQDDMFSKFLVWLRKINKKGVNHNHRKV